MNYPGISCSFPLLDDSPNYTMSYRILILKDLIINEPPICASIIQFYLDKMLIEAQQKRHLSAIILITRLANMLSTRIVACHQLSDCIWQCDR
jgi:hypothetical protein